MAFERCAKTARDGFDFRKFWHDRFMQAGRVEEKARPWRGRCYDVAS
jgi:hypothetical protein